MMKSKRRTANPDANVCRKKIITRNMQNKIAEDTIIKVTTSCYNHSSNKTSPNTRAKSGSASKGDSDPYSTAKMDEDCKLPIKKIKVAEKNGKDVAVNTCHFTSMTDPESLGPCEPGTSISLQGIVWLETATGLLVINVTWRGRTYVGTLMDSTKYDFKPPFTSHDFSGKLECRQASRPNRGKKRFVPYSPNGQNGIRSSSVRQSRRLSESLSSFANGKKTSGRLAQNGSCYVDSLSVSAEASNSGESDSDVNHYQKYALASKTRSVTRSLTKQNKPPSNDKDFNYMEIEDGGTMEKCSQANCFKKFSDTTGLRYHLQRSHGVFEEASTGAKADDDRRDPVGERKIKVEDTYQQHDKVVHTNGVCKTLSRIVEKIKNDRSLFEFNSDSEVEKIEEQVDCKKVESTTAEMVGGDSFGAPEKMPNNLPELSIKLIDAHHFITISGGFQRSPIESFEMKREDSEMNNGLEENDDTWEGTAPEKIETATTSSSDSSVTQGSTITAPNNPVRTILSPIVSIPCEPMETAAPSLPSLPSSLIIPRPPQSPTSLPQNLQARKVKQSKKSNYSSSSTSLTSFQVPSSSILSKKNASIPLKVAVSHSSSPSSLSSCPSKTNLTSPNHSCRSIRSSTFLNVTPILPATSTSTIISTIISSSITSLGSLPCNGSGQGTSKRTVMPSSNVSPIGMTSLLSLKPIQPKPKSCNLAPSYSNPVCSSFANPAPIFTTSTISTILPSQAPYQRQILPSPVPKAEVGGHSDEHIVRKIDSLKTISIKKKRKKSEKKLRLNPFKHNRLGKCGTNPSQLTQRCDYTDESPSVDNYKMDEENSHSPGYSDLSETNDTPAPILEKEVELKSGDCDKLVICKDLEGTSNARVSSNSTDSYDDRKESPLYNKPPALLPAVLRTDLQNRSTNDFMSLHSMIKITRRKRWSTSTIATSDVPKGLSCETDGPTSVHPRHVASSLKSFLSLSPDDRPSQPSVSSQKDYMYSPISGDETSKGKLSNKGSNLSAINDFVWRKKNNHDCKQTTSQISSSKGEDAGRKRSTSCLPTNGRFSVQALTSPQEVVSRSITTSSTVIPLNPNIRLENSLYKN